MAFDITPFGALFDLVGKVIDRVVPDPAQKAAAQLEVMKLAQNGELANLNAEVQLATNQTNVNTEEAKSTSMFIAGWRPFVGWVCGTGFAIQMLGPLLTWGSDMVGHKVVFPPMDFSVMGPTLFGMLGIGAMRTVEKFTGTEGNR